MIIAEFKRNVLLLAGSTLLSIILLEILPRSLTSFPINLAPNRVPHEELIYVLDSALPDVDEKGFRNDKMAENQEVVAVGNSHTYENNVSSDKLWPQQLAEILGVGVYNMGVGGYTIGALVRWPVRLRRDTGKKANN